MKKILLLLAFTFLIFSSCKKDEPTEPEVIVPDVVLNNEINEFIWEGMNYWYYWQADQPTLADNRKTNRNEFYKYFCCLKSLYNENIFLLSMIIFCLSF